MHNIDKDHPPTIVFFGDKDNIVPVSTAEKCQQRMHALGLKIELHDFKGQPHGFFNWHLDQKPQQR